MPDTSKLIFFYSACPNHLSLPFLATKLTGSHSNNSLILPLFFLSLHVNLHIHLLVLHSDSIRWLYKCGQVIIGCHCLVFLRTSLQCVFVRKSARRTSCVWCLIACSGFRFKLSVWTLYFADFVRCELCFILIALINGYKSCVAVSGTLSHSYGVPLAIWDHTVLCATRHKWTHPALTPARQAVTQFTYPWGMEGWVDLGDWLHTEMIYPPTDGLPSKY